MPVGNDEERFGTLEVGLQRRDQSAMQAGEDIAALAEETGIELLVAEDARRQGSPYSAELIARVFRMLPPEADTKRLEVLPLAGAYAVVSLSAVKDGELTEDDLIRQQTYRRRIANATANSEAFGFIRMLRSQSEIEVFEDRL